MMTCRNLATAVVLALAIAVTLLPTSSYLPGDAASAIPDQIGGTALATHGNMTCWEADVRLNNAQSNLYWITSVCGRPDGPPMCGIMLDQAQREVVDAMLARLHACGF